MTVLHFIYEKTVHFGHFLGDRGGGVKKSKQTVTYFMDTPLPRPYFFSKKFKEIRTEFAQFIEDAYFKSDEFQFIPKCFSSTTEGVNFILAIHPQLTIRTFR